jgi:hypothetical protein
LYIKTKKASTRIGMMMVTPVAMWRIETTKMTSAMLKIYA